MSDIMLDIETLSTRPEAVILTIGILKFDPYSDTIDENKGLYLRINVDEQLALDRHVDDNTVEWWGKQADDVRDEALSDENRISLEEFTCQLNRYLVGSTSIWAQGPVFDIVILEHLYKQLGKPAPWNYWQIRDSRTLFGVHGDPRVKGRVGHHNALSDCVYQAEGIQRIYTKCEIEKGR